MAGGAMKTCTRCVMPETAESLDFDATGTCSVCKQQEVKRDVDWTERTRRLLEISASCRGNASYDCIVPFSGGKDSTYTLFFAIRRLGLKPLVVRFDHGFLREGVLDNSRNAFRRLGCDVIHFTPNWHVVKKLMLESLRRRGDFCWHCHTGVFAYPMQVAVKWKVPLVIWGENDAEYASWDNGFDTETTHNQERFDRVCNLGINAEDMAGMVGLGPRDLACFAYPSAAECAGIRSVFLGNYIPWDSQKQAATVKAELGWQGDEVEGVPPQYDYDKIECAMQGVRDYIKYLKRGFGRTAHLTSIDVRAGRMTREQAAALTEQYDGRKPWALFPFLEMLELSEGEFEDIVRDHTVPPHEFKEGRPQANEAPHDYAEWPSS